MAVDSTTGVTTTAATDSGALGKARLATNFNTFLTLLTTQLKNQDPLSPLDSNQFTQQLTQMTGVEQQIYSNDLLKQLVTNTGSGISTAVALIGKNVVASSADQGLVKGKASWSYNLPRAADSVQLEVLDANGKVVQVAAPTDMSAGDHSYTWNGKDLSGKQLSDGGPYTMKITAKDSAGADLAPTVFVKGVVSGVEQSNGKTLITLGGAQIPWETVTSISQTDTATTGASTTSTNNTTTTNATADAAA